MLLIKLAANGENCQILCCFVFHWSLNQSSSKNAKEKQLPYSQTIQIFLL